MAHDAGDHVVFFDVDNTLLDNDAIQADLGAHLQREFGRRPASATGRFSRRCVGELGYADYLGALQRYRLENLDEPELCKISLFLLDYPFAERLYNGALAALAHCGRSARP